jgi:hypothetical protein
MGRSRQCPRCAGSEVTRSRTRNFVERMLKHVIGLVPFRCLDCDRRFFRQWARA